jgi:hypothetical protein
MNGEKSVSSESSDLPLMAIRTFIISLVSTAFAEIMSLPFYYPFDLVKVRMQTMHAKYGYRNIVDAYVKIWKNKSDKKEANPKIKKINEKI